MRTLLALDEGIACDSHKRSFPTHTFIYLMSMVRPFTRLVSHNLLCPVYMRSLHLRHAQRPAAMSFNRVDSRAREAREAVLARDCRPTDTACSPCTL